MELGAQRWSLIASRLPGRIGKQCRERWTNHLDPHLKKSGWSSEEDVKVVVWHAALGSKVLRIHCDVDA